MRILVSNDDGIYSPGLVALAEVARKFGQVRIVAPDVEQSSMGQAISSSRPVSYKKVPLEGFDAYRVNGTPADCVAVGMFNWSRVDLVLSGINLGTNLGNAIWHSGTLAAAKQGALFSARGIAFSMPVEERDGGMDQPAFRSIMAWTEKVLALLLEHPEMRLVNVNIPKRPKGIRWARQSCRYYDGKVVRRRDPMGRVHYWYAVAPISEMEEDTDRWAFAHHFASVTPLRLDLTEEILLDRGRAGGERPAGGALRPRPISRRGAARSYRKGRHPAA